MESAKILGELRAKIAANRKELEEQEHALAVLERMLAQSSPSASPNVGVVGVGPLGSPIAPSFSQATSGAKISQKEIILSAIQTMEGREFTVTMVDEILKKNGNGFEGKNPKNRISVILGALVDEEVIKQTHTGGGNVPHRYQKV